MANPNKPQKTDQTHRDCLVKALDDMRDTLVQLSLALQDLRFESDAAQRQVAEEESKELLDKTKRR